MRGLFSDGVDALGGQAKTILIGHLQETGRFNVVDPRTWTRSRARRKSEASNRP